MKKAAVTIVIAVAIIGVVIGGYFVGQHYKLWGEPASLRIMKKEPMASKELLGLELVEALETGKYSFPSKLVIPSIERMFATDAEAKEMKQRAIDAAVADGWEHDADYFDKSVWLARKQLEGYELVLTIQSIGSDLKVILSAYEN